MNINVLGYTLQEGIDVLIAKGFEYKILYYYPPKHSNEEEYKDTRIVRVRLLSEKSIELIVCKL